MIRDFDATMDKLLDTFFVSVKQSKAFRQNQQKIIREDRAFCEAGEDEFGVKVRCRDETVIKMSYQTPAKKYRLLKLLAAWLQDDSDFEKYSYYGCHCFPTGMDDMAGGHGEPMDKIDRLALHKSKSDSLNQGSKKSIFSFFLQESKGYFYPGSN